MKYPTIMTEDVTLMECYSRSIARFGDGELRCAIGGGCTSQRPHPKLAAELQGILQKPTEECMVGLPNPFNGCPREESWIRYTEARYAKYFSARVYASAFITRPDNAPWIDRPDYWAKVRGLWKDRDIVLVVGDKKSITSEMIGDEANTLREVNGPRQHAYEKIDELMEQVGTPAGTVMLCLGTTATVMAYRLSLKGVHALDLGHIGMFLRHAGAYRYGADDVASAKYREQLQKLHRTQRWGADGAKHTQMVLNLWEKFKPATTLDYGCGENKLADSLATKFRISGYDPGIPDRAKMPKPCDFVVCTDVLEHVEPEKLDAVLDHLYNLTAKVAYFVISTKPAKAILPDGRNAHLSIHDAEWWQKKLTAQGWKIDSMNIGKDFSVVLLK